MEPESWNGIERLRSETCERTEVRHFGPFLIALTESWKQDCKCYGSFSKSDLKTIEETASCAISIHSSSLTIGDKEGNLWP